MICNNNSTTSASSLGTLCGLYNYGSSHCIYIWILMLPNCQLLGRLAFRFCRLARRGPRILVTGTTTDILCTSHLKDLRSINYL